MKENTKLGAAVVGGYILGRTKKGMAAARFAMWLSGSPQVMNAARTALAAPEVKQVTDQLSGPLADTARKAALAAVLNRVGALNDTLVKGTNRLQGTIEGTAETVTNTATDTVDTATETVGKTADGVTGLLRPRRRNRRKEKEHLDDDTKDQGEDQGEDHQGEDQGESDEEPQGEGEDAKEGSDG